MSSASCWERNSSGCGPNQKVSGLIPSLERGDFLFLAFFLPLYNESALSRYDRSFERESPMPAQLWCITFLLFSFLYIFYVSTFTGEKKLGKRHLILLIPMSAVPMFYFAGVIFTNRPRYGFVLDIICVFELISSACAVVLLKGTRGFAIAFLLLLFWFSWWCAWFAGMSIANQWI